MLILDLYSISSFCSGIGYDEQFNTCHYHYKCIGRSSVESVSIISIFFQNYFLVAQIMLVWVGFSNALLPCWLIWQTTFELTLGSVGLLAIFNLNFMELMQVSTTPTFTVDCNAMLWGKDRWDLYRIASANITSHQVIMKQGVNFR